MKDWSTKRRASFAFHATMVAIPFSISTVSAAMFWHGLFASWWIAAPMVVVVDILALSGLVLYVLRVESPFTALRHALPFISIIPLGLELYGVLTTNNAPLLAGIVAAVASIILVAVAWQCFSTIERLFIPPIEAARERAREQMETVRIELARLEEMQSAADAFARERLSYHAPLTLARVPEQVPAFPEPVLVQSETTKAYKCPNCGAELKLGAYGSAKRYGHCASCKS